MVGLPRGMPGHPGIPRGKVKKCYQAPSKNPGGPLASVARRRPKGAGPPGFLGVVWSSKENGNCKACLGSF